MNKLTLPLLVLMAAGCALAEDSFAGAWKIEGDVAGNAVQESCTLKQDGGKITGSCKGLGGDKAWEVTGSVEGGAVTFQHGGEYNGEALTLIYKAKLDDKGALKGTIDVKPFDVAGEFTAKKDQ